MKRMKHRHWRTLLGGFLAIVLVSLAACGGETVVNAARGFDPTPTPSPAP